MPRFRPSWLRPRSLPDGPKVGLRRLTRASVAKDLVRTGDGQCGRGGGSGGASGPRSHAVRRRLGREGDRRAGCRGARSTDRGHPHRQHSARARPQEPPRRGQDRARLTTATELGAAQNEPWAIFDTGVDVDHWERGRDLRDDLEGRERLLFRTCSSAAVHLVVSEGQLETVFQELRCRRT